MRVYGKNVAKEVIERNEKVERGDENGDGK